MSTEILFFAVPVIFLAYAVFGMTGFGAALVAVPLLVHVIPLQTVVPLIVFFDLVSTTLIGGSNRASVSVAELKAITPWMLLGILLGATLLYSISPGGPLIALGIFVLYVSIHNLFFKKNTQKKISSLWAVPFGIFGGVFSALFGTGGPIYTIYLARRLDDLTSFRATISAVIFCSGFVRLITFAFAGAYFKESILWGAAFLLPSALLGLWSGSKLRKILPHEAMKKSIYFLLLLAGVGTVYKGLTI